MADLADRAQERMEHEAAAQTRFGKPLSITSPQPTGFCLWCGEELDPPRRWCNAEHRDEWEGWDGNSF